MILVLPDGLKFFQFGWWVIHAVAIYLVYSYAHRKGRRDERRRRDEERQRPK
jgi:hypothetical protein